LSSTPAFAPVATGAIPRRRDWTEQHAKYIFLMPAVLYLLLLGVFPLIFSVYLVFNSWQAGSGITFVGLDNIRRIAVDDRFLDAAGRTVIYVALAAGLELLFGLLIALCLQVATRGKAALRLALALPMLLPPIAISFAWKMLFDFNRGPVNYFLEAVGLPPVLWLSGQTSSLISLVVVDLWQWTPFVALATLAALESLTTEI
jgi:multiple sugar transport system permease protein